MMDGIAMVELLVGLPDMRVLGAIEGDDELVVTVETTVERAWCPTCGRERRCRTARHDRCVICRASGGQCGSRCGAGGGDVESSCARPRRGPRTSKRSTQRRC